MNRNESAAKMAGTPGKQTEENSIMSLGVSVESDRMSTRSSEMNGEQDDAPEPKSSDEEFTTEDDQERSGDEGFDADDEYEEGEDDPESVSGADPVDVAATMALEVDSLADEELENSKTRLVPKKGLPMIEGLSDSEESSVESDSSTLCADSSSSSSGEDTEEQDEALARFVDLTAAVSQENPPAEYLADSDPLAHSDNDEAKFGALNKNAFQHGSSESDEENWRNYYAMKEGAEAILGVPIRKPVPLPVDDVSSEAPDLSVVQRRNFIDDIVEACELQPLRSRMLSFSTAARFQGTKVRSSLRQAGIVAEDTEYAYRKPINLSVSDLDVISSNSSEHDGVPKASADLVYTIDAPADAGPVIKVDYGYHSESSDSSSKMSFDAAVEIDQHRLHQSRYALHGENDADGHFTMYSDEESSNMGARVFVPYSLSDKEPLEKNKEDIPKMVNNMLWGMVDSIITVAEYSKYANQLELENNTTNKAVRMLEAIKESALAAAWKKKQQ